ncbi:hypothetical protein [Nostoc sp. ChiSLP03a]|uniref:hypothetical protein n=1 Tax=Nostoc sp. ChiSLP03a TaxID=3075380 RepID=UPI002AD394B5|nr:hypothetical protein [Nostoc sp. ChiSLP03a]MDZ8211312.1 hypothetical protein [Nostoc sp. ChiSLP03a]
MDNTLEKLIKQLHSKRLSDNVANEIIKLGKPAFDYLLVKIDEPSLTEYQVINLLRISYQMKYHNITQFTNKLLSITQDKRIDVRSTASFLAICLFRIKKEFPELNIPLQREALAQFLHKSLAMELHQTIGQQVESFFQD